MVNERDADNRCVEHTCIIFVLNKMFEIFEARLRDLLPEPYPLRLAVGVSGGADSLCLTWLLARWAHKNGLALTALTVDHRLRPESKREAEQVTQQMALWGVQHVILPLENPPTRNLQERARGERYRAMALFCHTHDIPLLFLGHHQADQLETWGMRLIAGSGLHGLGGMLPLTSFLGLQLLRPFLTWQTAFLRKMLEIEEITWSEDPSNRSRVFQRTRIRPVFQSPTTDEYAFWCQEVQTLNHKRQKLEQQCQLFLQTHCHDGPQGYVRMDRPSFLMLPTPVQHRALSHILTAVGGMRPHPVSHTSLHRLVKKIERGQMKGITCGGCYLREAKSQIWITREWKRIQPVILEKTPQAFLWDGRFYIDLTRLQEKELLILRPQGLQGGRHPELPVCVTASLPALFNGDTYKTSLCSSPFATVRWLGASLFQSAN